jgi:hypothetical protein
MDLVAATLITFLIVLLSSLLLPKVDDRNIAVPSGESGEGISPITSGRADNWKIFLNNGENRILSSHFTTSSLPLLFH